MSNSKFGLRTRKGIIRPFVEGAQAVLFDADALAYITANTAITSTADKNAINTFFLGLKSDGIYTKMKAMYLPIWGSDATCKFNLVAPNGSYDLTFRTGWTFSSGGMTPSNTYAETSLVAQSIFPTTNIHLSTYSRTQVINNTAFRFEIGAFDGTNFTGMSQQYDNLGKFFGAGPNNSSYQIIVPGTVSSAITTGLQVGNRLGNVMKVFQNGTELSNKNVTNSSLSTNSFFIGAYKNLSGGYADYSNRQLAFVSIGDGLTDTQATNLNNRVNTLMTYFGINV